VVERDAPRAVVEVQKRERPYDAHAQLITSRSPINAFCVTFKKQEVPRPPSINKLLEPGIYVLLAAVPPFSKEFCELDGVFANGR
jgi:hypothetical protein